MKRKTSLILSSLVLLGGLALTTPLMVSCSGKQYNTPPPIEKTIHPYFWIDKNFSNGSAYTFNWVMFNKYGEMLWSRTFEYQLAFQKNENGNITLDVYKTNFSLIERDYKTLTKLGYSLGNWIINI